MGVVRAMTNSLPRNIPAEDLPRPIANEPNKCTKEVED
jgi:hypothetical protein